MSGQNQVDKAVERIFSMAQKVQQLTNPQAGGEGGGWLDWLKPVAAQVGTTLAPRILPFLQPPGQAAIITPAPSPAVAIAAPPQPSPEPVPPAAPPSSEPTPEQQAAQFAQAKREALAFTLGMARLNRPAEIWADFTIEQTETTSNPILARFLQEITAAENFDKWFTELQQIDPGIITQRQWFEVYFLTIRDTLTAKASETQDSD
jgi:pyruvate/2-oxoglutarate dehydrogenase complex dihydrolipoamide acyltransferase (E2) component